MADKKRQAADKNERAVATTKTARENVDAMRKHLGITPALIFEHWTFAVFNAGLIAGLLYLLIGLIGVVEGRERLLNQATSLLNETLAELAGTVTVSQNDGPVANSSVVQKGLKNRIQCLSEVKTIGRRIIDIGVDKPCAAPREAYQAIYNICFSNKELDILYGEYSSAADPLSISQALCTPPEKLVSVSSKYEADLKIAEARFLRLQEEQGNIALLDKVEPEGLRQSIEASQGDYERLLALKNRSKQQIEDARRQNISYTFLAPQFYSTDVLAFLVVVLSAALGASVSSIRRLGIFSFKSIALGMAAGYTAILVIRGGRALLLSDATVEGYPLNIYGIAFAGLIVGMFTERAYELLSEVIASLEQRIRENAGVQDSGRTVAASEVGGIDEKSANGENSYEPADRNSVLDRMRF